MSYKRPKATYLAIPIAFVPEVGKLVLEQWAEHQEWWQGLPFAWMTVTILAAFACHSVWGEAIGGKDLALEQHPIYASRNIVEISVASQTYRIYTHVLDTHRKEHAYVYLLTEDDLPDFSN